MADFKTHITVSTLCGAGYGAGAYWLFDLPAPTCVLAGGLCSVSGMLPDLDSGPGVPLRESMAFAAAVVPMMLLHYFQAMGLSHEMIVLAGAGVYLAIRFGLTELLKLYTVHRGMFHSIPAAVIAGELAFLLASGENVWLRAYKAGAVSLGYLSHLALDELWALHWRRGQLRTKSSFGTALKLFGRAWWPNVSVMAKLILLSYLVWKQPGWAEALRQRQAETIAGDRPAAASVELRTAASADGPPAAQPWR
jgi:hypothetical protein